MEVLDPAVAERMSDPFELKGDRYDQLRACVGEECCQRLAKVSLFMVSYLF